MVATGHVTAAAEMNLSYLPGGANAHPPYSMHFIVLWSHLIHCRQMHLNRLSRFVQLTHRRRAWIDPSYSPGGANVHSHLIRG